MGIKFTKVLGILRGWVQLKVLGYLLKPRKSSKFGVGTGTTISGVLPTLVSTAETLNYEVNCHPQVPTEYYDMCKSKYFFYPVFICRTEINYSIERNIYGLILDQMLVLLNV